MLELDFDLVIRILFIVLLVYIVVRQKNNKDKDEARRILGFSKRR